MDLQSLTNWMLFVKPSLVRSLQWCFLRPWADGNAMQLFEEVSVLDDCHKMNEIFRIQIFCILKAYLSLDCWCCYCCHLFQVCIDDGELVDWHGINKIFGIWMFCILELTFPKIALIIAVIIFVIAICEIIINF